MEGLGATLAGMKSGPTMQQIAEASGYSRMAVSLALRNSPEIAAGTRRFIQEIAREMGYRPNPLVSTLMAQRAGGKQEGARVPLALVNTFADWNQFKAAEYYRLLLEGMAERAAELGFYTEVFTVNDEGEMTSRQLDKVFRNRGIRGVIILPVPNTAARVELSWEHYSAAVAGRTWQGAAISRAMSDQFGNATELLRRLREAGYRRPGLLLDADTHTRTSGHFAAAYYLDQRERGEEGIPPLFRPTKDTEAKRRAAMDRWIREFRPDVIIGHGDEVERLERLGWSVPGDVGYANLNLLPSEYGRLSGIDQQAGSVGRACVDLVVARLHRNELGLPAHRRTVVVDGEWRQGASTTRVTAAQKGRVR